MAAVFFIFGCGYFGQGLVPSLVVWHQPVVNLRHFFRRQTIIHILVFATDAALALAFSHDLDAGSRSAAEPLLPTD
jgi:hypothetical protein